MEKLKLNRIHIISTDIGTKVCYDYEGPECFMKYTKGEPLFVEFPGDLRGVPESILTIPFVGVMLTATMLLNVEICVPILDEVFCNSIGDIEKVFQNMYPKADIRCGVSAECLQNMQSVIKNEKNSSLFFTGGVDATSALISIKDIKPLLINVWGGDLHLSDDASHNELEDYLDRLSGYLGIGYSFVKTNARIMFDEAGLGNLCKELIGQKETHGWWASIAHILSMASVVAPWLWHKEITMHYIGSSYDPAANTFDSNNSEIINALKFGNSRFASVDEVLSRSEKAKRIIEFQKETNAPLLLKVCWHRTAGQNCGACEKCYRTILNIISNHGDPNKFGFEVSKESLFEIKHYVENNSVAIPFWRQIQETFLKEEEYWRKKPEIAWVLTIRFNTFKTKVMRIARRLLQRH